jgi:hypothetical protein
MYPQCPNCGVKFERNPILLGLILHQLRSDGADRRHHLSRCSSTRSFRDAALFAALAFTVAFPLLLFPWARSLCSASTA